MSQNLSCAKCGRPAKRKCTRCGQLFCDLHVRYGNPHFAFNRLVEGSNGYYCDECWEFYAHKAKRNAVIVGAILLLGIFFFIGWIVVVGGILGATILFH